MYYSIQSINSFSTYNKVEISEKKSVWNIRYILKQKKIKPMTASNMTLEINLAINVSSSEDDIFYSKLTIF